MTIYESIVNQTHRITINKQKIYGRYKGKIFVIKCSIFLFHVNRKEWKN